MKDTRPIVIARGIEKFYGKGDNQVRVLSSVDLEVRKGEMIAVVGASGAGKSTLLYILGALTAPNAGSVQIEQFDIAKLSALDLARFRNTSIGFVFQFHHLLPEFTALENTEMPLLVGGLDRREAQRRASEVLERVDLGHRQQHRPGELSGGEQQRVALARALVRQPLILLADEPTGNLDGKTGDRVLQVLKGIHVQDTLTSIIVTHNERVAAECDRVLHLRDGKVCSE